MKKDKKEYIKLFCAGFLSILASAPIYFMVVMFFSISYLYYKISHAKDFQHAFKKAMIFGFGYYLANTYWICFSLFEDLRFIFLLPIAITIIPFYFATFLALCMGFWKFIYSKIPNHAMQIFAFAVLWVIHEKLRATMIFPFPWWPIGMTVSNIDAWIQPLSIISINFFSFFIVLLYLVPILAMQKMLKWQKILSFIFIFSIHGLFLGYGYINLKNSKTPEFPFNIGILQTNFTQYEKFSDVEESLYKHHNLTIEIMKNAKKLANNKPNLIVWPETSIPYPVSKSGIFSISEKSYLDAISNELSPKDRLIFGAIGLNEDETYTNAAFLFSNKGIENVYDKINLVPFGEYVPLIPFKIGILPSFTKGKIQSVWNIEGKNIIPLICYEILFDKHVKKLHPDLIINISNDGWFGNSIGPYQHLAHARISAIKNGVPVIRVANTGISAIIDKNGRIFSQIDKRKEGTLVK